MRTAPTPPDRLLRWGFGRYLLGGFPFRRGFLAKHFHAVRRLGLFGVERDTPAGAPWSPRPPSAGRCRWKTSTPSSTG